MADRSKAYEIVVAACGVAVTAILGYGQYQLGKQQALMTERQQIAESRRASDAIEVQVMQLVGPQLVSLARPGPEFAASQKVVLAASEYLTGTHGRTALAAMAAKIAEGNAAVTSDVTTRLQEASAPAPPAGAEGWFTVLATLPPDSETAAKQRANQWLSDASAKKKGASVALYKTKISNHYAVVLGGSVARATAVAAALDARRLGLSVDAFAQQDREWRLVGSAPFSE